MLYALKNLLFKELRKSSVRRGSVTNIGFQILGGVCYCCKCVNMLTAVVPACLPVFITLGVLLSHSLSLSLSLTLLSSHFRLIAVMMMRAYNGIVVAI